MKGIRNMYYTPMSFLPTALLCGEKKEKLNEYQQYHPQCAALSCRKSIMFPDSIRISLLGEPQNLFLE